MDIIFHFHAYIIYHLSMDIIYHFHEMVYYVGMLTLYNVSLHYIPFP